MILNKESSLDLRTTIQAVLDTGGSRVHFKKLVRKNIIKFSTSSKEITGARVNEAHKIIDTIWAELVLEAAADTTADIINQH